MADLLTLSLQKQLHDFCGIFDCWKLWSGAKWNDFLLLRKQEKASPCWWGIELQSGKFQNGDTGHKSRAQSKYLSNLGSCSISTIITLAALCTFWALYLIASLLTNIGHSSKKLSRIKYSRKLRIFQTRVADNHAILHQKHGKLSNYLWMIDHKINDLSVLAYSYTL